MQDRASGAQLDSILGRSGMGSGVLEELRQVPCYAVHMNVVENDHAKSFIKVEVVVMVSKPAFDASSCVRHVGASQAEK
jgi:hypothetical protein